MTSRLIILLVLGAVVLGVLTWLIVRAWRYRRDHPDETLWPYNNISKMLLTALLLAAAGWNGTWGQNPSSIGSIHYDNTLGAYRIATANNLRDLSVYVNGEGIYSTGGFPVEPHDCSGLIFKQTANIVCSDTIRAIGTYDNGENVWGRYQMWRPFKGTYDGQGYVIDGLKVKNDKFHRATTAAYFCAGMFGATDDGAVLRNIRLVNPSINNVISLEYVYDVTNSGSGSKSSRIDVDYWYSDFKRVYYFLAGIVGDAKGTTIEDCYVYNPAFSLAYRDSALFVMEGSYGFPYIYSNYNYICNEEESTSITGCSEVYLVRTDLNVTFSGIIASGSSFTYSGNRYYKPGSSVAISYTNTTPNGYDLCFTDGQGHTLSHSGSNPNYTVTSRDFDIRITPSYNPTTYQITYNNVDGVTFTTENPSSYNIETETFTLNRPRREGYTFLGWTGTDLERVTQEVTISRGSIGDRTYTAQWVEGEDPIFDVTNSGSTFTITRDVTSTQQTVYYRTVSLSAIAGQHFTQKSGTLTFGVGESSKNITVTETPPSEDAYKYQTSDSRSYRFEVLDEGGFELAHKDRDITSALTRFSASKVSKSISNLVTLSNGSSSFSSDMSGKYKDISFSPSSDSVEKSGTLSGYVLIDDSYDYKRKWATVSTSTLISSTNAPATYLNSLGYKIYATVCFTEKEKDDGYQYIQIIAGNKNHSYDGADPNGAVNDPSNSIYKVCFEFSNNSNAEGKAYFPHRGTTTSEFSNSNGKLWQQKYKSGTSGNGTGCVILDPTTSYITTRFDAGGNNDDTWGYKDFFVRMALCDPVAPTRSGNPVVNPGPHANGNIAYVSVPFSEMVTVSSTSVLYTSWGNLKYVAGSGTNVLTFADTINAAVGTRLQIMSCSGSIKDLAGNSLSGSISYYSFAYGDTVTATRTYTITYTLNGGTVTPANPTSYNYSTPTFTLINPTRTGYSFNGWTGSDLTEASKSVTVATHSHGDRRFIANWTPHTFVIVFNKNHNDATDSTDSMDPMVFAYDEAQALVANTFTRAGCSFDGWSATPDGDIAYTDGQSVSNLTTTDGDTITLYAQWTATPWAGSGTQDDPWQISCPSQLDMLADSVNSGIDYKGKYFEQTADLVYNSTTNNYTPIGGYTYQFHGTYDGGGHSVSGINVSRTGFTTDNYHIGLFGHLGTSANVHSLTLASSTLTGYKYTGGIAAYNRGTVSNCRVESTVAVFASREGANCHGGVVGCNNGTIAGCLSAATVSCNGLSNCNNYGGIAGFNNSPVRDCLYTGTLDGSGNIGGIVTNNSYGQKTNNYFTNDFNEFAGERRARTVTLGTDVALVGSETTYSHSGLTAIGNTVLSYNDGNTTTLHSGYKQNLTLTYAGNDALPTGQHHGFGYYVDSDPIDTLASNTLTMPAADVTIVHFLLINTYTVKFKPNGGSGSMADQAFTYGVAQNLSANAFSRSGYVFTGWNTASDGSGTAYTNGQEVNNLTATNGATVTLYAQWTPDFSLWHADADHDGTTAERAYIITTTQGLDLLASLVNGGNNYSGTYFRLGADITYSYTSDWNNASSTESNYTPIGNSSSNFFKGTFNGCGHTVSGIRIRLDDWYAGLFGYVNTGGTVKNVTLADSRITSIGKAGVIGWNEGTAENCHSAATVALYAKDDKKSDFGGIVGWNRGTVRGCTSAATISNNGKSDCTGYGGIVGYNDHGTVENCLVLGADVTANNYYGSVVGRNYGTVTNCHYRNCSVNGVSQNNLYTVGGATGITVAPSGDAATAYPYGGIEVHGTGIFYYGSTLYAVEDADVSLTLHANLDADEGYGDPIVSPSASSGTFSGSANPYALTMPAADVTISGTFTDLWGIAGGADGTNTHPYLITTPEGLVLLSDRVEGGNTYSNKHFHLGADIDMSGVANFNPIGSIEHYDENDEYYHFKGIFKGDGHTISHLTINKPDETTVGLFRYNTNSITTLTLDQATITGHDYVGAIVGEVNYNIQSCLVLNSTVTATGQDTNVGVIGTAYENNIGYYNNYLSNNYYHNCTVVRNGTPATTNIGTGDGDKDYKHGALQAEVFTLNVAAGQWQAIASPLSTDGDAQYLSFTDLTRGSYDLFGYDERTATWLNQKAGDGASGFTYLNNAHGYIYRAAESGTRTFYGIANSGNTTTTNWTPAVCSDVALRGFYLLGNPYNHSLAIDLTPSAASSDITTYSGTTLAPGYYTLNPDGSWQAHTSGTIAPGQAFLVQFIPNDYGQAQFRIEDNPPAQSKGTENGDRRTESLTFTVSDGEHSDIAYAIIESTSQQVYESTSQQGLRKFGHLSGSIPSLSIARGDGRYAVATLGEETRCFDLAFSGQPSSYTLTASGMSGYSGTSGYLHLIDRLTGKDIDLLRDSSYIFEQSSNQAIANRFLVKFASNTEHLTLNTERLAFFDGDHLVVNGEGTLQVYDMMGRLVMSKEVNTEHSTLNTSHFPGTGVYVLRLGGKSQKVVIK